MCGETLWSNLLLSSKFSREREREYIYNRSQYFDISRSSIDHFVSWWDQLKTFCFNWFSRWLLHLSSCCISSIRCTLLCSTIMLYHHAAHDHCAAHVVHDLIHHATHVLCCSLMLPIHYVVLHPSITELFSTSSCPWSCCPCSWSYPSSCCCTYIWLTWSLSLFFERWWDCHMPRISDHHPFHYQSYARTWDF